VHAGLKNLEVLKTTQSGFVGYLRDQYTVLPEVQIC
jgi:urate oxidase